MCYDCDMGYSLSGIGGSGDYVALQYEMDSSSMCVTMSMATTMHRLVNLKERSTAKRGLRCDEQLRSTAKRGQSFDDPIAL